MRWCFRFLATAVVLLTASVGPAVERVEIVLDASSGMWKRLGDGPPKFVAVRGALLDYAAASVERQGRPEIALRVVGGSIPFGEDGWCDDTRLVAAFGLINPEASREALDDLVPRGGRPLVRALAEAVSDLEDAEGGRRIVVITSGADQCHEDIITTITSLVSGEHPIEFRIIGLGLDRELAAAATLLAPTRNLVDPTELPAAVKWALQPADTRPAVARPVDLEISFADRPVDAPAIELTDETGSERAFSAVENGRARIRLKPGRYRATIEMGERPEIELAGLVIGGAEQTIEMHLSDAPPVTLDVSPEQPLAGGVAQIGFWGAPEGSTWVALAMPDTAVGTYLVRAATGAGSGTVDLVVPEFFSELEARFIAEPIPGVVQLLGRRRFDLRSPQARLECAASVENRKPFEIAWTGPGRDGDHVMIAAQGDDTVSWTVCVEADREHGRVTVTAPADPGSYTIFYRSVLGDIIARQPLEVFEVLATLDAPATVAPDGDVEIAWTGPDAPQDFINIAAAGSPDDAYLTWAPTSDGDPTRLGAPSEPGSYELRYIRSDDGAVLARRALDVVAVDLHLTVPNVVAAGTRFTVQWRGTARSGDFFAIARPGSSAGDWLDFTFAETDAPTTLAAPFEPGDYEVRYVSGEDLEIVSSSPLTVE